MTNPQKGNTAMSNSEAADGFTKFPNALFGTLKIREAAVYLALNRHAGMKDGARPSIERVMAMTRMKQSAVKAAIGELREAGLITSQRRGARRPNRYKFADLGGTFTPVPNAIWRMELDPAELMLWVALAELRDLPYGIFPTVQELATKMRASKTTVAKATRTLVARGLVEVTRDETASGGACRNHYRLQSISDALTSNDAGLQVQDQAVLDPTGTSTHSDHHQYRNRPSPVLNPTITSTHSDHEVDVLPRLTEEDSPEQTHIKKTHGERPGRCAAPGRTLDSDSGQWLKDRARPDHDLAPGSGRLETTEGSPGTGDHTAPGPSLDPSPAPGSSMPSDLRRRLALNAARREGPVAHGDIATGDSGPLDRGWPSEDHEVEGLTLRQRLAIHKGVPA